MAQDSGNGKNLKWYRRDIDPLLGYAPGVLISDEVAEYRSAKASEQVILHRFHKYGFDSVHNLMGLTDNCELPDFFKGPEYKERFLSSELVKERLDRLAKEHLGGGDDHATLAFNRTAAANATLMLALVPPGSLVPYLVPAFPGTTKGHGHPSVPRGIELAGGRWELVSNTQELEQLLDRESNVPLIAICASYRSIISEEDTRKTCDLAHARGIAVFLDDASGARSRIMVYGQPDGIAMGADLVVTSCEKFGLEGPRAAVMVGREDLMLKIGAKANLMGTEARPGIMAGMVHALEEYDPAKVKAKFAYWEERHRHIQELARGHLGDKIGHGGVFGVYMTMDDFMEVVMDRAGIDEIDLAPVDASMAHALAMLRDHGFMTVTNLHYPGAVKIPTVRVNYLQTPLTDEAIARGFADSVDRVVEILPHRDKMEEMLFAPPQ